MRKIVLSMVILVFVLCVSLLVLGITNKIQKQVQINGKIQKLPSFSFMTLTDGSFSSSDIRNGPVLVVRFHPECEHCRYEITEILNSNIPVSGTLVLMVSSANTDSIRKLLSQFDLSDYPAIIPLVDTSYIFGDIFGSDVVPSNYIYDKQLDLVKALQGEVKTETILKYLQVGEQDK
jgi:thiol-disulfide isomerase/thioredoxin